MREDSPLAPSSKKGALRVELASERLAAHARGDVRVTVGRASDFFGEDLPYSCWSDRFFQRLYAGKPGECMGDPDMPHSYTYAGDVRGAGLLSPFLREVLEMTYQWEMPFSVDDSRFRETFGYGATPVDVQVRSTAAWARSRFVNGVAA
jgi:hypothetical protein